MFYANDIANELKPIFAFPRLTRQIVVSGQHRRVIFLNESGLRFTKVRIEKTGNMVSTWNVTLLHRYNVTLSIFLYAKISIEGVIILLYIMYYI